MFFLFGSLTTAQTSSKNVPKPSKVPSLLSAHAGRHRLVVEVRGFPTGEGIFEGLGTLLKRCWAAVREPERKNTCKMLLISPYCNHIQKCPES